MARRKKDHPDQLGFADWVDRLADRARADDVQSQAHKVLCVVLALMGIGLLVQMGFDASVLEPPELRDSIVGHALFRLCALSALLFGFSLGPHGLRRFLPALTVLVGLLLIGCFLPGIGVERNGSHRWVSLFGLVFQPSELARMVVVLWIADRCVRLGERVTEMRRGVLPMLGFVLVYFALVLAETDLGGAMLLLLCAASTMWFGGVRSLHLTVPTGAVVAGTVGLGVLLIPYVRRRIELFLGESENLQVAATQLALRGGGPFGAGLGQGGSRLASVPYLESDYVFAQIGEELGLFGMLLVLGLYALLLWHSLRLVLSIPDRYEALAAFGLLTAVGLQAMLHVQVVTGLAPPKGMTLPFVSDGGTSLVVSSLAVGLALGAARRTPQETPSCLRWNAQPSSPSSF